MQLLSSKPQALLAFLERLKPKLLCSGGGYAYRLWYARSLSGFLCAWACLANPKCATARQTSRSPNPASRSTTSSSHGTSSSWFSRTAAGSRCRSRSLSTRAPPRPGRPGAGCRCRASAVSAAAPFASSFEAQSSGCTDGHRCACDLTDDFHGDHPTVSLLPFPLCCCGALRNAQAMGLVAELQLRLQEGRGGGRLLHARQLLLRRLRTLPRDRRQRLLAMRQPTPPLLGRLLVPAAVWRGLHASQPGRSG